MNKLTLAWKAAVVVAKTKRTMGKATGAVKAGGKSTAAVARKVARRK